MPKDKKSVINSKENQGVNLTTTSIKRPGNMRLPGINGIPYAKLQRGVDNSKSEASPTPATSSPCTSCGSGAKYSPNKQMDDMMMDDGMGDEMGMDEGMGDF
jgi:hypothetical protein